MAKTLTEGDFDRFEELIANALFNQFGIPYRPPDRLLFRMFKFNNVQSAPVSMVIDGSVTPQVFAVGYPFQWLLFRVMLVLGGQNITSTKFGNIAELTNGLRLVVVNELGEVQIDFKDGGRIKANRDWASLGGVDLNFIDQPMTDLFIVRWTIVGAGAPILMGKNFQLQVIINDDLTGLDFAEMMSQGFRL